MHIAEIAKITGLSIDTIRFYDKSGMLPDLPRDARGWRLFPPPVRDWLKILGHLRKTGMPLEDVRAFAASVHRQSAETKEDRQFRLGLLRRHAKRLAEQRATIDACEAYLAHKIAIYAAQEEGEG